MPSSEQARKSLKDLTIRTSDAGNEPDASLSSTPVLLQLARCRRLPLLFLFFFLFVPLFWQWKNNGVMLGLDRYLILDIKTSSSVAVAHTQSPPKLESNWTSSSNHTFSNKPLNLALQNNNRANVAIIASQQNNNNNNTTTSNYATATLAPQKKKYTNQTNQTFGVTTSMADRNSSNNSNFSRIRSAASQNNSSSSSTTTMMIAKNKNHSNTNATSVATSAVSSEMQNEAVVPVVPNTTIRQQGPPTDPNKWLEDISPNHLLGCGATKCTFSSLTNPDYYGYLIMMEPVNFTLTKHLNRTYALAEKFSSKFSIHHGFLGPPQHLFLANSSCVVVVDAGNRTTIQNNCTEWTKHFRGKGGKTPYPNRANQQRIHEWFHSPNTSLVVQPVGLYHKGSFVFKCRAVQTLIQFRASKAIFSETVHPQLFEERLRLDYNRTIQMMTKSAERKCLSGDFQLVIDATTGKITHIDWDRCFEKNNENWHPWNEQCEANLGEVVEYMIQRKYNHTAASASVAG